MGEGEGVISRLPSKQGTQGRSQFQDREIMDCAEIKNPMLNWMNHPGPRHPAYHKFWTDYLLSLSLAIMLRNFVSTFFAAWQLTGIHFQSFGLSTLYLVTHSSIPVCWSSQAPLYLYLSAPKFELWILIYEWIQTSHFLLISSNKCFIRETIWLLVLGLPLTFVASVCSFSITSDNWSPSPGFPIMAGLNALLCFYGWTTMPGF